MNRSNQNGSVLVTVGLSILIVLALVFGLWAFSGRQDYKNKSDAKVAVAVAAAKQEQVSTDKNQYDELLKQPYKSFQGPSIYGTISFQYPKTWSAYVDQTASDEPINGYFHPGEVPGVNGSTAYRLRVELQNSDYSQVVEQYSSDITQGTLKASAYVPPKLKGTPNVQPGLRLDGAIDRNRDGTPLQGSMVILKVRDKTLQIYTQTTDGLSDFNNIVLPSLTFIP
jgi:type II secretory pathway pseudopilin PulG